MSNGHDVMYQPSEYTNRINDILWAMQEQHVEDYFLDADELSNELLFLWDWRDVVEKFLDIVNVIDTNLKSGKAIKGTMVQLISFRADIKKLKHYVKNSKALMSYVGYGHIDKIDEKFKEMTKSFENSDITNGLRALTSIIDKMEELTKAFLNNTKYILMGSQSLDYVSAQQNQNSDEAMAIASEPRVMSRGNNALGGKALLNINMLAIILIVLVLVFIIVKQSVTIENLNKFTLRPKVI